MKDPDLIPRCSAAALDPAQNWLIIGIFLLIVATILGVLWFDPYMSRWRRELQHWRRQKRAARKASRQ